MKSKYLLSAIALITLLGSLGGNVSALEKKSREKTKPSKEAEKIARYPLPFDYKGIKLGMTPDEFKAVQGVAPTINLGNGVIYQSEPLCSGEYATEGGDKASEPRGYLKELGGLVCRFSGHMTYMQTTSFMQGAVPKIGDFNIIEHSFLFLPRKDGLPPKLYQINLEYRTEAFNYVVVALVEKFGNPAEWRKIEIQNKLGSVFTNEVVTWDNETGTIVVEKYSSDLTKSSATFELKSHIKYYLEEIKKIEAAKGPKI